MLKAIIFDFDGVLCESVDIKTQTFRRIFQKYPRHVDKIVKYHERNGGISRYEKFKYIYSEILREPLSEAKLKSLGEDFSRFSLEAVINAPMVKGAEEFLNKYYKNLMFFIVSGTPQTEMSEVVKRKGMDKYFRKVLGSPQRKAELVAHILRENNLNKKDIVFVGDSINDYEGAYPNGIRFIGRVPFGHENPFTEINLKEIVGDIDGLEKQLKRFNLL